MSHALPPMSFRSSPLAAVFLSLLAVGCGEANPPTVPVSGTVTWQGQPVPHGHVMFYPAEGRPAIGTIGPDGSYELTTFEPGDGALPGAHVVTVHAVEASAPPPQQEPYDPFLAPLPSEPAEWIVPQAYSQKATTPLRAEVTPEADRIDFHLPQQ